MKRHPALVPFSHAHHRTLVEARRLRRAAEGEDDPAPAAEAFAAFFAAEVTPHVREEEDSLFPLVAEAEEARTLLTAALLDHQRLRALVRRLGEPARARETMSELGKLLEAHVRLEERELFPLIERQAAAALEWLGATAGGGPLWGEVSEDVNATLLAWPPGGGPAEHVNEERDVLLFVVEGSATVVFDGEERRLGPQQALIVPKGRRRRLTAGAAGVRYLSVHLRRPPLQIRSRRD